MILYSKGTWEIKQYSEGTYFIKATGDTIPITGAHLKKANAALISAAPEMFEFLIKMFINSEDLNDTDYLDKTLIEAGDIIAKIIERGQYGSK